MTLTNPPVAVSSFDSGRLAAGISAAATTITISPIYKTVNGVRTKQGLDTTSGIALITHGDFTERVSFEGASVNATTKVTTLTTCTRGLSATSTSASFTGGTGRAWPKGAKFTVVADVSYFQSSVYTTVPNSFSAKQTFAAGADFTSVTRPPKLPTLSQAQENALTPEEGMMWKNSDTGTNRQYVGGSIVDIGDAGTPNGSTTVAGKFEAATAAQRATGTGTGETGALLIPTNDALVKTSSGAGDENKIAVLDADGLLADGFLANAGTPDDTTFLRGDRTWGAPSLASTDYIRYVGVNTTSSSALGASSTADFDFNNHQYTIPANDLIAGVAYEIEAVVVMTVAAGNIGFFLSLGSTKISIPPDVTTPTTAAYFLKWTVYGTAAAGASVTVKADGGFWSSSNTFLHRGWRYDATAGIATNGSLVLKMGGAFRTSNAGNNMVMEASRISKVSSSAF